MKQRLRRHLDYFIRGLLMGGADIIPGVSGGTIALIVNVYERLIASISELVSFGLSAVRANWAEAHDHWRTADWGLLLPLGAGIVTALIGGARIIPGLMERYPAHMLALFFGLVAASLVIPWRRIDRVRPLLVGIALVAALGAFFFVGLPQVNAAAPSLPRVFGSAAVAICAMILPGVSGAFLLEVLGIYTPTLNAVNQVDVAYIATFVAGAATGLAAFAKLLDFLLSRYHDATMAALIGLIAGALRALWPYTGPNDAPRWPAAGEPVGTVIAIGLLGFIAVIGLIWWGARRTQTRSTVESSSSS